MKHTSFETMNCAIAQTLEVIGERWSILILRDCYEGLHRFGEFQHKLGISKNVLATRLQKLVKEGRFLNIFLTLS